MRGKDVTHLRKKLVLHNRLLSTLANSTWGTEPYTLKLIATAPCYYPEYCSSHAHKVDTEFNKACRTITGTLRVTPVTSLYRIAGIFLPDIYCKANVKIGCDSLLMHVCTLPAVPVPGDTLILKSRRCFITVIGLGGVLLNTSDYRSGGKGTLTMTLSLTSVSLLSGKELRKDWITLNRARTKVSKTVNNLVRWGIKERAAFVSDKKKIIHILRKCPLSDPCTNDLKTVNSNACHWIQRLKDKI